MTCVAVVLRSHSMAVSGGSIITSGPGKSKIFLDTLNSTIDSFQQGLPQPILNDFQKITSLTALSHAIADIERRQAGRRSFRNLGKIRPFLNSLQDYGKVIEVFVNVKPDIMAFIWGPIKFCLQVRCDCQREGCMIDTDLRFPQTSVKPSMLFLRHTPKSTTHYQTL